MDSSAISIISSMPPNHTSSGPTSSSQSTLPQNGLAAHRPHIVLTIGSSGSGFITGLSGHPYITSWQSEQKRYRERWLKHLPVTGWLCIVQMLHIMTHEPLGIVLPQPEHRHGFLVLHRRLPYLFSWSVYTYPRWRILMPFRPWTHS